MANTKVAYYFKLAALNRTIPLLAVSVLLSFFIWGGNQPAAAGLFSAPWDKLAHLSWFAVLSGLLRFGLGSRSLVWVTIFCLGVGVWDEWRQLTLPGRSAGLDDLLFDGLGIVSGLVITSWLYTYCYDYRDAPLKSNRK